MRPAAFAQLEAGDIDEFDLRTSRAADPSVDGSAQCVHGRERFSAQEAT